MRLKLVSFTAAMSVVAGPTTAADGLTEAATTSAIVAVSRAAASLSVTTNASSYASGSTATVTAHLGTTYNGRTVTIYAQPYGGNKTPVKTGTVDGVATPRCVCGRRRQVGQPARTHRRVHQAGE
jgi:hypothetical protein